MAPHRPLKTSHKNSDSGKCGPYLSVSTPIQGCGDHKLFILLFFVRTDDDFTEPIVRIPRPPFAGAAQAICQAACSPSYELPDVADRRNPATTSNRIGSFTANTRGGTSNVSVDAPLTYSVGVGRPLIVAARCRRSCCADATL